MKKRILIFSLVYYPKFVGGAEVAVKEITDRLGQDFEFDMVTLRVDADMPRFEKIGNINIYRIGAAFSSESFPYKINLKIQKYLFPFLSKIKAQSLHKIRKYDFVWAIMANFAGFGASFFKKSYPEIKFVLTLQEGDPLEVIERKVAIIKGAFLNIFRRADILQAISRFLGEWGSRNGFKGKPIVIPNGVDIAQFTAPIQSDVLSGLEDKLQKLSGDIYLVTTSRLVKKNGIEDVIRSMSLLAPNIKFLILGTGPGEKKLKDLTANLGLVQRVDFLGFVPHADMPKYLKISDIFVRPSLSEGLGNSFLEAMAAGLPVVATLVGGIPDFLVHKKTGIAVEVSNPKDLAEKIQMLLADKNLRDEIVKNAREMVLRDYDWNKIAQRMREEVFN